MAPPSREYDLGFLKADMEEAKRQHANLFRLIEGQTDLLNKISEEMRRHNDATDLRIAELEKMKPVIKDIEALRNKGWGMIVAGMVAISILAGGMSEGAKLALKKFGFDL